MAATGNPALGIKGLPDAAKQKTTDGAIAFVKYYVSVINYVGANPSSDRVLAQLSLSGCKVCSGWDDGSVDAAKAGTQISGEQIPTATSYSIAADLLDLSPPQVHVRGDFPHNEFRVIDSKSGAIKSTKENPAIRVVFLTEWASGRWMVAKVQQDTSQ